MNKAEKHLLLIWKTVKLPAHIRNEITPTIHKIKVKNSVVLADVSKQREQLPKRLSNEAYKKAKNLRYEEFVEWWDNQV